MAAVELTSAKAICSADTLAAVLGITRRHVGRLTREGVLPLVRRNGIKPRYRVDESVQRFLKHRKDCITAEHQGKDNAYDTARAQRMQAGAELEELRLLEEKGQLHRGDDLEFLLTLKYTAFKTRLLACPSRLMHELRGLNDPFVINQKITDEICLALTELSKPDFRQGRAERAAYLQGKLEEVAQEHNGERPLTIAAKKEIAKLAQEPEDNFEQPLSGVTV